MATRVFLVVLLVLSTMVVASATSRNITEVIADNTQTTVTGQLAIAYPMNHSAGYTLTDSLGTIILIPSSEGEGDLYRYNGATIEVTGNLVSQDGQRTLYMEKWVPQQAAAAEGWPTVSGAQSTLLILFQFNNLAGTHSVSYFQSLATGASNSMTAYFDEDSYGMAWVTGGPTSQWYTLPHPSTYYNVDHWGDCISGGDYTALTADILNLVDPYVWFPDYVGTNKHILFVSADSYVWGCAITWGTGFLHDGVYITHAAYIAEGDPLSTYLHEFSHDMGLPDLYDYTSPYDPYNFIDSWDLMSIDNAQHHSSWCKIQLGWITSSRIRTFSSGTDTQGIDRIEYTTTGYHTFKIHTSGMPANIYYLVETRQKIGFDINIPASAPDHGVLITKIDESLGSGAGIVREVDHNPTTQQNYDGDAVWDAGDTYTNAAYGFQVIIGSWDGWGFSITVTTGGVPPPATFEYAYDDGVLEAWSSWLVAGGIYAVRFTPALGGSTPLKTVRFYIYSDPAAIKIHIMDQSRTDMVTPFVATASATGWFDVDVSAKGVSVTSGVDFYIGAEWTIANAPKLAGDTSSPDGRSWKYSPVTGLWTLMTSPALDFLIRAVVQLPSTLLAPSSLVASAVSSSQINLSWQDNSGDESDFHIERKTGSGGSWSEITQVSAGSTSYSDTGLSASMTYYYRVCAHRHSDSVYSSYSNEASATTSAGGVNAPSNLAASAVSSSQINPSWQDNSGDESDFHIERKTGAGGLWGEIAAVPANSISYPDTGLSPSTTYYYRVRAHRHSDNVYSDYSNEVSATTAGQVTLSQVGSLITNAPAGNVYYIYPATAATGGVKDPHVIYASATDFAALGTILGMSANTQNIGLDSNGILLSTQNGQPRPDMIGSGKAVAMASGPVVHAGVHYYEVHGTGADRAPVYFAYDANYFYFKRSSDNAILASILPSQAGVGMDIFLIEVFQDANGRTVFILYGFTWLGTLAATTYFKFAVYPSLSGYTKSYYLIQWMDAASGPSQNGIPDMGDVFTQLASGSSSMIESLGTDGVFSSPRTLIEDQPLQRPLVATLGIAVRSSVIGPSEASSGYPRPMFDRLVFLS